MNEQRTSRNARIGAIALAALAAIFALALLLNSRQDRREAVTLAEADALMLRGTTGDCAAFGAAKVLYVSAMRMHLQSKLLAGKANAAGEIEKLCGRDLAAEIDARAKVVATGRATAVERRALAVAQLAAGDLPGAQTTLREGGDDPGVTWMAKWANDIMECARRSAK